MEKQITIQIPEGYKDVVFNKETKSLEFIKEPIRSKSWEEFCKNHSIKSKEFYVSASEVYSTMCNGVNRNTGDSGYLASKADAEGILALIQLTRLHDEWVGDWKHKDKFDPTICVSEKGKLTILDFYICSLLQFPTFDMAQEFLKCFKNLIEKAKKFI